MPKRKDNIDYPDRARWLFEDMIYKHKKPLAVGSFSVTPKGPMVGGFNPLMVTWRVSHRPDTRHGTVSNCPKDPYYQGLVDDMFRKWGE